MRSAIALKTVRETVGTALAEVADSVRESTDRYRYDPFAFLELVKVWNPVTLGVQPFKVWDHQRELLEAWMGLDDLRAMRDEWREDQELPEGERSAPYPVLRFSNVLGEKSRQMGDTVGAAGGCLWVVTFWDSPLLMQHQDLQEVDDGGANSTWDSFFGKIRLMHSSIEELAAKAPLTFRGGNAPLIRNRAHPQRFVTGEGQTPDPGRGGRYAGVFLDEAARLRYDQQGQAALARACPEGRLMLSTPQGKGNVYYRIRNNPPVGWTVINHHWSKHPDYSIGMHVAAADLDCPLCAMNLLGVRWSADNPIAHRYPGKLTSPWYESAHAEFTDEQVAEELDIDYAASLTARVFTEFDEQTHVVPRIPYDEHLPLEFSWDYGWDMTSVGIWQDAPMELRKIGEWEGGGLTPEHVVAEVLQTLRNLGVDPKALDRSLTPQFLMVGDPAGEGTQLNSGEPLTADYARLGFVITNPGQNRVATTLKVLKRLLLGRPKPIRYSRATCPKTIEHMQMNRWPVDNQGNRRIGATKPQDDIHNHACRADSYYATFKWPIVEDDAGFGVNPQEPPSRVRITHLEAHGEVAERIAYDTKL